MPLPLLLVPAIAAVAATTTASTVPTTAVVGIAAGSAAAGGVGAFLFFRRKAPTPSPEHVASLKAQHEKTTARIKAAQEEVDSFPPKIKAVASAVKSAAARAEQSAKSLQQTTKKSAEASTRLKKAVGEAQGAGDALDASLPQLKTLAEKVHQDTAEAIERLKQLNEPLTTRETELAQAHEDIRTLRHTVDEQTNTITQLTDAVEVLTTKNAVMDKKIIHLTVEAERANRNCRFFKEAAQKGLARTSSISNQPIAHVV